MNEKNNSALDDLNHMQAKITSLFQDIINERYQCNISLEESQRQAEKLLKKIKHLENENGMLKNKIERLKNTFVQCIVLFQNSNFSFANFLKLRDHLLETFQKTISNVDEGTSGSDANGNNSKARINVGLITSEEKLLKLDEGQFKENIKKEIKPVDELQLSTQFFSEDCVNENLPQKCVKNHCDGLTKPKDILLMAQEENLNLSNRLKPAQGLEESFMLQDVTTPKKIGNPSVINNSPVFRDLGNRKQGSLYLEDVDTVTKSCKSSPANLVNEKFLLNTVDEISPVKRAASRADSFSPGKEILRAKRNRTKSKLDSPKRSPKCQLKSSNSKEAEISLTGIRKFTQTVLNVDCFKKTGLECKKDVSRRIEGRNLISQEETSANEAKFLDDEEDDDVIMESPCNSQEILEIYSNSKTVSNGQNSCTPTGADLDETFVSSSIVRKCRLNEEGEHSKEESILLKSRSREKSPEFDSVPFFYKREAVRKKAERMKLPGQVCLECDKYYNIVFGGEIKGEDFKKLLNKCSRHRDRIPLDVDNTPPGFWKPYLTASVITSPSKNN